MEIYVDANTEMIAFISSDGITKTHKIKGTNNENEYRAVLFAVDWYKWCKEKITIYSDSQLVVNQLNHKYNITEDRLRELAVTIWDTIKINKMNISFEWIPREKNIAGKLLG